MRRTRLFVYLFFFKFIIWFSLSKRDLKKNDLKFMVYFCNRNNLKYNRDERLFCILFFDWYPLHGAMRKVVGSWLNLE